MPIDLLFDSFDEACDTLCEQDTHLSWYMRSINNVPDLVRFALKNAVSNGFCMMTNETARNAFKLKATQLLGVDFD